MWKYIEKLVTTCGTRFTPRQRTGLWGEHVAEQYLAAKGYKILGRRFHIGPKDEIDLIGRDDNTLVFIEVKARANEEFGRPFAAVDRRKQYRMARAAIRYLKRLKSQPVSFRFDVIEVLGEPERSNPLIRHIEAAFPLPKCFRIP